jgi:hypothetical protein
MSPSDGAARLTLDIRAADSGTEIFVVDGGLQLADRGIGHLVTKPLDPGIYKIKSRAGVETREQYVALSKPGQSLILPPFAFASPAPLADTSKTHEYHVAGAQSGSRTVHVQAGSGSAIFVFSREWTASSSLDPSRRAAPRANPAAGLWLLDAGGATVADLGAHARVDSSVPDPFAACNVAVDPGVYRLAVDVPGGARLEETVVACAGWQTQMFFLQRNVNAGRCADLVNGTVLMARGMGFLPDDSEVRQGELARLALANGRKVLSGDILQMLGGKFGNPMMGIFGGHLLLMDASPAIRAAGGAVVTPEKKPDLGLLAQVVLNLRGLVGVSHPDVEALALACGGTAHRFSTPPMLRRSWAMIVDRTVSDSDLVPIGSLAADAAAHVLSEEPWLVWTSGDAPGVRGAIERNIASALRSHVRSSSPMPAAAPAASPFEAIQKMRVTASSAAAAEPAARAAPAPPVPPAGAETPAPLPAAPLLATDESKIGFLVRTFGIPRSNVESMLLSMTPGEDADDNAQ